MQTAEACTTPGQADVERFGGELGLQGCFAQGAASALEFGFDCGLDGVDCGTRFTARVRVELTERLEALGEQTTLAYIARLGMLKLGPVCRCCKIGSRLLNQLIQVFHVRALPVSIYCERSELLPIELNSDKKKEARPPFFGLR